MKLFFKKSAIVSTIIFLELFLFLFLKDGMGNYSIETGRTISDFFRQYGGYQFFLAAYIPKIAVFWLLSYLIAAVAMVGMEMNSPNFYNSVNQLGLSWTIILENAISFLILVSLFIVVQKPEELIATPYSFQSIVYALSPVVWIVYLYSSCDLLFPARKFFELINQSKLFVLVLIGVEILIFYPGLLDQLIDFWSNLLLVPTIHVASVISQLFGLNFQLLPDSLHENPLFGSSQFYVEIASACSGYEGLSLAIILLGSFILMQRQSLRLSRSLIIIPLAGVVMFILNAFRIFVLVAIGHYWSPELAINGFHSVAGWLNLLFTLIFSILILNYTPYFQKEVKAKTPFIWGDTVLMVPLMAIIVIGLLTKAVTADFSWLYPVPILAACVTLYSFRKPFLLLLTRPSIPAVAIGVIAFVLWIYLIPEDDSQSNQFNLQIHSAPLWLVTIWLIFRVIGASLIVPIAEEFTFRGYIQPHLQEWFAQKDMKSFSVILSLALTSLLFGYVHSDILAGSVAGALFGLAYLQRKRVMDAVVAHAVTNALLAAYVLSNGYWSYW